LTALVATEEKLHLVTLPAHLTTPPSSIASAALMASHGRQSLCSSYDYITDIVPGELPGALRHAADLRCVAAILAARKLGLTLDPQDITPPRGISAIDPTSCAASSRWARWHRILLPAERDTTSSVGASGKTDPLRERFDI
jgi:hypothetical protein